MMFVNNGFILAGLTTFDGAMLSELGLTFGALKLRDTVTLAALGIAIPFVGLLLDRVRIRPIIVCGLLLMAAGFMIYAFVHTAWQMYAAQVLLGASQACCGLIAQVVLVSRWTSLHRGLALGMVVAGSSLGNAVTPALNGLLLAHFVWRDAILCGGVVALGLIPVVFAVYRERPAVAVVTNSPSVDSFPSTAQVLRSDRIGRTFWLLGIVAGTSVLCVLGLVTNLALYVSKDLHLPEYTAPKLLFALFFASSVAQILAGLAADRFGASTIHRTSLMLMLIGMCAILIVPSAWLLPTVAVFGIGWGGNSAMLQLQPVALFSSAILGRTLGMLAVMETIGGAVAPALVGYARDYSGSYRISFAGLALMMALSVGCVWPIRSKRASTEIPAADGAGLPAGTQG